ncbi:MAG: Crp/Fnr family transcriptional regulator [Alphaproteobacteria bacterium]
MTFAVETLKALPLFSSLSREEGELLIRNSRIAQRKRGKFLFLHGDAITHFYVVCRGTVQIFRETPDGHEVTSNILIAGDCVNAEEVVSGQNIHLANARAVDEVSMLEIPIPWLREHLKDFGNLAAHLLTGLAERLRSAEMEAEHLTTMSAAQIVACYLQKLCVLYNFNPHGFELPYTKTLIASRLRMELETFSRSLQKIRDQGIVVTGSHVSFTNVRQARNFSCDECSIAEECTTHQILHERLEKRTGHAT